MKIDHDALVMVVDGGKMLLFRNDGDATYPQLVVEEALEQVNPAAHDQASDAPGRAYSSDGTTGSAVETTDFHQQNEDRLAAEAAALLNKRALARDYEQLVIVAPPRTLGEMRKHYHKELEKRLIGEIAKDLTGHPVTDIEQTIMHG
ncbi:host attachment family protein [Sphingobium nicotianae]|uniref:Host attachment protein n=1 Tax=Sphingobium nicotianae TaxID=2782607 RepID=A0A9X1AJY9_9SPHN|nr:host attachment family protein [Sphingobium nicotianae]MBT2185610.1 host attachment protein [Sphingobium nicotianae]